MNRLVFSAGHLKRFREGLLRSSLETAAFVLASPAQTPDGGFRLIVRRVIDVPDEAYEHRSEQSIRLSPAFVAGAIKTARTSRMSVILVHTHPFHGDVEASPVDIEGERMLVPTLFRRIPNVPHGRVIFGHGSLDAALFDEALHAQPLIVQDAGPDLMQYRTESVTGEDRAFDRQIQAFGVAGQTVLRSMRVAIIGLGGVGSIVAQQLAHLGVNDFILVDPDTLENTNLNRVVGAGSLDVGRPKVEVAAHAVRQVRADASVTSIQADILSGNTVRSVMTADFVFCCTDSQGSRALLTQVAYQFALPVLDIGVRIDASEGKVQQIGGRVQLLAPGLACLVCQNLLDPEAVRRDLLTPAQRAADRYIVGSLVAQPAVISLNGTVASLGVTMFLSAVVGIPVNTRHQIVRFESGAVRAIQSEPDPGCVVCSPSGALGRGDEWPLPTRLK